MLILPDYPINELSFKPHKLWYSFMTGIRQKLILQGSVIGSTIKSICSFRGLEFGCQNPLVAHEPPITLVPGDLIASFDLYGYHIHMQYRDLHAGKTLISIK